LRAPLVSLWNRGATSYSALPIETLIFGDCGRFWIPNATSANAASSARTLCGAGAGARINAAGFVFEFDGVRPFGPTANGWRLSVNFLPGF